MAAAISAACVSSAKCPVSKKRTTAPGMSRLNASAPRGRKNGSFLPHTALRKLDDHGARSMIEPGGFLRGVQHIVIRANGLLPDASEKPLA